MTDKGRQTTALARKDGLVVQELSDEVLIYDLERDRAHCLNQTAAYVWQHCNGKNSTTQIARSMGREFGCTVDEKIVWLALDQLGRNHLLQQPAPTPVAGMNRRAMVRAIGLATVVAAPLVTSILAPTPAQAATCTGAGGSCTDSSTCCSGLTCQSNTCQ